MQLGKTPAEGLHELALRGFRETDPERLGDIFEQLLEGLERYASRNRQPDKTTS